jgi:hypothetical protein
MVSASLNRVRQPVLLLAVLVLFVLVGSVALAAALLDPPERQRAIANTLDYGTSKPTRFATDSMQESLNVTGGKDAPPAALLAAVRDRYGGSAISSTTLSGPPSDFVPTENPNAKAPPELLEGEWLRIEIPTPKLGPEINRSIWEANLVAGAFRDELRHRGLPGLAASHVFAVLPDGRRVKVGGGVGNVVAGQQFSTLGPDAIHTAIRAGAAEAHLRVSSISVLRPLQLAPAVVGVAEDVVAFVREADRNIRLIFGPPGTYEGEYLEVHDASGGIVFVHAASFRTGVGQRWTRADLDTRRRPGKGFPKQP